MKKKLITLLLIALITTAAVSAATFDGLTSVGVNYEFRDGMNLGGLSSQTFGYINDFPLGYLISANADFNLADDAMTIGLLIGPSYRYMLESVPMSIELALGASASGQWYAGEDIFDFGIGGYLGATYYLNDAFALLIGCNLGYDMLSIGLGDGEIGFSGDFYVSPSLSFGFRY